MNDSELVGKIVNRSVVELVSNFPKTHINSDWESFRTDLKNVPRTKESRKTNDTNPCPLLEKQKSCSTLLDKVCDEKVPEDIVAMIIDMVENKRNLVVAKNGEGLTALHKACESECSLSTVELLIKYGGKELIMVKDKKGQTALHKAYEHGPSLETVKVLIKFGGKDLLMVRDKEGRTVFHIACQSLLTSKELMKILLDEGGEDLVLATDKFRMTALHIACGEEVHENVVQNFFDNHPKELGLLVKETDNHDMTALHIACQGGTNRTAVRILLDNFAEELIMERDEFNRTALHVACKQEIVDESIVESLIKKGKKKLILAVNDRGKTALHLALKAELVNENFVFALIDKGGKELVMMKTNAGKDALRYAKMGNASEDVAIKIIEQLLEAIADDDDVHLIVKNKYLQQWLNNQFIQTRTLFWIMMDVYLQIFAVIMVHFNLSYSADNDGDWIGWQVYLLLIPVVYQCGREAWQIHISFTKNSSYFSHLWNFIDVFEIIMLIMFVMVVSNVDHEETSYRAVATITIGLVWLRILGVLKNLVPTICVFLVATGEVIVELVPFFFTTAVIVASFAEMFYYGSINSDFCNDDPSEWMCSASDSYAESFSMLLSGARASVVEGSKISTSLSYIFAVVISLIFLNLIIALLSEIFGVVKARAEAEFWKNRFFVVYQELEDVNIGISMGAIENNDSKVLSFFRFFLGFFTAGLMWGRSWKLYLFTPKTEGNIREPYLNSIQSERSNTITTTLHDSVQDPYINSVRNELNSKMDMVQKELMYAIEMNKHEMEKIRDEVIEAIKMIKIGEED